MQNRSQNRFYILLNNLFDGKSHIRREYKFLRHFIRTKFYFDFRVHYAIAIQKDGFLEIWYESVYFLYVKERAFTFPIQLGGWVWVCL